MEFNPVGRKYLGAGVKVELFVERHGKKRVGKGTGKGVGQELVEGTGRGNWSREWTRKLVERVAGRRMRDYAVLQN